MQVAAELRLHALADAAASRLEARFRVIADSRMADMPILNKALTVRSLRPHAWHGEWLTALLTPWFLNLVLLPEAEPTAAGDRPATQVGAKRRVALPAGTFEFIVSHDEEIGEFAMCSLFSPVLEFADQETAVGVAETSLAMVLETPAEAEADDAAMLGIWRGEVPLPQAEGEPVRGETAEASHTERPGAPAAPGRRGLLFGSGARRGGP